jgi:hypothetical protein
LIGKCFLDFLPAQDAQLDQQRAEWRNTFDGRQHSLPSPGLDPCSQRVRRRPVMESLEQGNLPAAASIV